MIIGASLCKLLAVQYPILQGGMARIAGGRLAGTVSAAGGLGVIGSGGMDSQWLRAQIQTARGITSYPIAVNIMMASANVDEMVSAVIEEQVPVVTTGGGNPGRYISRFKEAGIRVIPVVASVALAKRLARLGADAVIAEGMESGGHVGEISTMALVPMVVDSVDVPVIAAGGIYDGRGIIACMALGAQGIQIGTRFLCSYECDVHPAYQEKVLKARDRDTLVCGAAAGHPIRAVHNRFTRSYVQKERQGASPEELRQFGQGKYALAALEGDTDQGTVLAGQVSGAINDIQSAADIVETMMAQAVKVLQNFREGGNG